MFYIYWSTQLLSIYHLRIFGWAGRVRFDCWSGAAGGSSLLAYNGIACQCRAHSVCAASNGILE